MKNAVVSAKVTKVITIILCVVLGLLMAGAVPLLDWYYGEGMHTRMMGSIICFYLCCPAAWVALISILKLMNRILKDDVFTQNTVKTMNILAYCCLWVTVVCALGGFFSPALLIFGCGAAFMTLILRVLKSVFQRAVEIKEENDMTV